MKKMDVFSVRELRNHSARLMKGAENGQLSIITKRGKPTFVAVPFGEQTLRLGVEKDLALNLFQSGAVSIVKAARMAGMPVAGFMELLGRLEITAVDYPVEELANEFSL
ncbi:MAG: type II toxin-antitoxin system Phd/YefM family antitoxin [Kiritimatiellae bacterium]|jgi:prevent-host-death family protein|nr:type II toxin-antitoxin system Phd/YefM family antitoxin [Kiritimatiellia bacterium]